MTNIKIAPMVLQGGGAQIFVMQRNVLPVHWVLVRKLHIIQEEKKKKLDITEQALWDFFLYLCDSTVMVINHILIKHCCEINLTH